MFFTFQRMAMERGFAVPAWLAWSWAAYPITTRRVRDGLRSIMVDTSEGLFVASSATAADAAHKLPQQRRKCKDMQCCY
jgi:hypothetical protein